MTNLRGNGELGQNIQPDKASNALLMLNMPSTLPRTRAWLAMVTAPTTTAKYTYVCTWPTVNGDRDREDEESRCGDDDDSGRRRRS